MPEGGFHGGPGGTPPERPDGRPGGPGGLGGAPGDASDRQHSRAEGQIGPRLTVGTDVDGMEGDAVTGGCRLYVDGVAMN